MHKKNVTISILITAILLIITMNSVVYAKCINKDTVIHIITTLQNKKDEAGSMFRFFFFLLGFILGVGYIVKIIMFILEIFLHILDGYSY
ncbi:MAG: hypothetical protein V1726_05335 [Methanobacteriota archaeon]